MLVAGAEKRLSSIKQRVIYLPPLHAQHPLTLPALIGQYIVLTTACGAGLMSCDGEGE